MAVISKTGLYQGDLVDFLSAAMTAINEIRTDHSVICSMLSELRLTCASAWSKIISLAAGVSVIDSIKTSQAISTASYVSMTQTSPAAISAAALSFTIT